MKEPVPPGSSHFEFLLITLWLVQQCLIQAFLVEYSSARERGEIDVCGGTVVRANTEQSVLIFFLSLHSFCHLYAEHWQWLVPMQILRTQSATCFLLYKVINCILLVSHVYSVLIKQLEWKPSSSWEQAGKHWPIQAHNPLRPQFLIYEGD